MASGVVKQVSVVRIHPRYVASGFFDDVAVLTLSSPLDVSTGRVAHCVAMSGPWCVCPAVVNAEVKNVEVSANLGWANPMTASAMVMRRG